MTKRLILGCASTGAKFTPLNHKPTGNAVLDRICSGPIGTELASSPAFVDLLASYRPGDNEQDASLHTHSTANGADYGRTSPSVQFLVYRKAVAERRRLGLLHEIERVQLDRSYAMARYAVEHPEIRLGDSQQLNITLLFGFSPRLPFPESYREFQRVVQLARSLEWDLAEPEVPRRKISIAVGAAVLPQHADQHRRAPDVGPSNGPVCALRRLIAYASRPDSGVDILRVGMEDTPYAVDASGDVVETDNVGLVQIALDELSRQGAEVETDPDGLASRIGLDRMRDAAARMQRLSTGRFDDVRPTYALASA